MAKLYYLNRRSFTPLQREMLQDASDAWAEVIRPQTMHFGRSDTGEEYVVVLDSEGNCVAHIGFTANANFFNDSKWFGYGEFGTLERLIKQTMPPFVASRYEQLRKQHA